MPSSSHLIEFHVLSYNLEHILSQNESNGTSCVKIGSVVQTMPGNKLPHIFASMMCIITSQIHHIYAIYVSYTQHTSYISFIL